MAAAVNQPKADRHAEPLQITGSHLRAVRKAVEHLSLSLGGCLHVVDTFASSKMSADKLNMCENVCVACGKKRTPSSEEESTFLKNHAMSPPHRSLFLFFGGSSICRAVASAATCKQVARTGCTGWGGVGGQQQQPSALHQSGKKALQETTNQEPLHSNKYDRTQRCALFQLRDSFTQCLFQ